MRVLLSAYACEPGKGSEPEVGLRTMLAAARKHDVWVLTRENNLPPLRTYLTDHPLGDRIHLVGLDVPGRMQRLKKRHPVMLNLYYDLWQRKAGRRAVELDKNLRFDLVHHVTFAAYWQRTGVAVLDRPLVWGPVGGGVSTPRCLLGEIGTSGLLEEGARTLVRPALASLPGVRIPQRRASVILTQNRETAARLTSSSRPIVLPNAVAISAPESAVPDARANTVVTVGRFVPWKGVSLAVRAFAAARIPDARLVVIGRGKELARVKELAASLSVAERITFTGRLPREEVLRTVAGARVLLHGAMHEEAGLAVSEALAYGTPVVCLDRGGPPELLRHWPDVWSRAVVPGDRETTVQRMATALEECLSMPPLETGWRNPVKPYDELLLAAYAAAVRHEATDTTALPPTT